MKEILLIVNYWHFEEEKISSRYRSFANILCQQFSLEVVTSSFCHLKKVQRDKEQLHLDKLPYKITMIYERGYRNNISIKRIISYNEFGINVLNYLKKHKKPDLIIVSVPSLAVADFVSAYAKSEKIPLIIDIQDLWPEAFKMAINIPIVSDVLFAPMMRQANRIYSRADVIMAVSDTYVSRGKEANPTADELSIYIGSDGNLIEEKTQGVCVCKQPGKFVVGYIGALGHSYDIKGVIDAIKLLKEKGINNILFKVMGEGVCREEYETYARNANIDCQFTGQLDYGTMMKTLMQCEVAVNPIVGKSASSIINKVADYAAAGIPVVNTQNSKEYRALLEKYQAGISVENGNTSDLAEALLQYYSDESMKIKAGKNEFKMYCELFDRNLIYPKLVDKINEMLV